MKKLILIIFVLLAIPVYAQNEYTEYEFKGIQETVPTADEFTRYETVILHNFYTLKEGTPQIIADDTYKNYDSWKLTNSKIRATKTPSLTYKNDIHFISKALTNLDVTSILTKNLDEENVVIEKVVFKSAGIEFYRENTPQGSRFTIPIEPHKVNDLEIEFYYTCHVDGVEFTINLNSDTNMEVGIVPLPKEYNKITIEFKTLEEYTNFLGANDFEYKFDMIYYTHTENTYECFNYDRVYLNTPLEDETVEGYTYDEEENKTLYKVYKRTKIEDKLDNQNIISPIPELSKMEKPTTISTNNKTSYKTSNNFAPAVDNSEVFDNTETKEDEKNEIVDSTIAFVDREGNSPKENSTCTIDSTQNEKTVDLLNDIKWLLTILIILIIIRLIHTFSVNMND